MDIRIPRGMAIQALLVIRGLEPRLDLAFEPFGPVAFLAGGMSGSGRDEVVAVLTAAAHFAHLGVLVMVEVNRFVNLLHIVEHHDVAGGQARRLLVNHVAHAEALVEAEIALRRKIATVTDGANQALARIGDVVLGCGRRRSEG